MFGKIATAIIGVLWGGTVVQADPAELLESCRANYQGLQLEVALQDCTLSLQSLDRRSEARIEALVIRGLTQFDLGRLDLALADLTSAHEIDVGNSRVLHLRANVFNELGLTDHAVRDYDTALAIDPFFAEAYINRAIAHLRGGAPDLAQQDADTAFLLKPDDPRIATVRKWLESGS